MNIFFWTAGRRGGLAVLATFNVKERSPIYEALSCCHDPLMHHTSYGFKYMFLCDFFVLPRYCCDEALRVCLILLTLNFHSVFYHNNVMLASPLGGREETSCVENPRPPFCRLSNFFYWIAFVKQTKMNRNGASAYPSGICGLFYWQQAHCRLHTVELLCLP